LFTVVNCKESLNLHNEAQPVAAIPIGTQTCSALKSHTFQIQFTIETWDFAVLNGEAQYL
jgi:hypothetical protein